MIEELKENAISGLHDAYDKDLIDHETFCLKIDQVNSSSEEEELQKTLEWIEDLNSPEE